MLEKTTLKNAATGKSTAASAIFAAIRRDILAGTLGPGSKLRIDALCERYEATINPVREALNRLSSEGLVDLKDQRGFSVAPVSLEQWRELVRSRCMIDACALREAIARRSDAWEEGIVLALYRLTKTVRFTDEDARIANPEWEPRHHAFHHALLAACGSPTILDFCEELRERSDRYRHIASIAPDARSKSEDEHSRLADVVISGDADLAVKLLTDHYNRTLSVVEGYFETLT